MKKVIMIAMVIFLISFTSAITIYAGDSHSFEADLIEPVYIVVGNSSDLEGMNITFNGTHITLSVVVNYKPDSFTLVFFDRETKEVIKEVRVGGRTRTIYRDRNITEYIEVPIETIVEIEKEVPTEPEPTEPSIIPLIIFIIGIVFLVIGIRFLLKQSRRWKKHENN